MLPAVRKINIVKTLKLIMLCLAIVCSYQTIGQQVSSSLKGLSQIVHYDRNDFNADPQFWSVCEGNDGVLYFGNNDGAIIFDGEEWHKIQLPNNSSIRSLATGNDGSIYAGGYNEFGLIQKDKKGQYYFKSLIDSLQFNDPKIENLWQVHALDKSIIYRSFGKLIVITGNKITKLPTNGTFVRSFIMYGEYYVQDLSEGILRLDKETLRLKKVLDQQAIFNQEIIGFFPTLHPNKWMAVCTSGKILSIDKSTSEITVLNELFEQNETNKVECAITTIEGNYYLGTISSGIITINKEGQVVNDSNAYHDLQDNSVLNLYQTNQGNIWALLNNGLDCITANSPVSVIFEGASLYDVLITEKQMYLATNQGIFYSENPYAIQPTFEKVKGLEGQGWSIRKFDNDIIASHDKGLFIIDKTSAKQIGYVTGIWKIVPISEYDNQYLAASYNGLFLLSKEESGWSIKHKIEGFDESSRDILETKTPGTYWVCHGYKGVFRIKMNESYTKVISLEHFTTQNGFTFPYSINVFEWNDDIVFTTNEGIFEYQQEENQFTPYRPLNAILDSTKNTRTLFQHLDKTWFVQDDEVGYFTNNANEVEKGYFLQFKGAFNRGMECIQPVGEDKVLLGTKTGLYLFDLTYKSKTEAANTEITSVQFMDGQNTEHLPLAPASPIQLPYSTSSFRIDFAAPKMQNDADIQYAYKLENIDKEWSDWQLSSHKEYSHLRPGRYTFKVKSRSLLGTSGEEASISFQILPLWYQTKWMMIAYILVAIAIILFTIRFVKRKIARENLKTRREEQRTQKLLELELSQLKLEAEKAKINQDKVLLEENVIHKSKELANYTMMLVKKKDIFAEIRDDMLDLRKLVKNEVSRKKIQKMYSKLNQHAIGEEYMRVFETNFEQVHHDFFSTLKHIYPDLSQRELRLCAFIKMNLSNKEISPLLNISVRGVETARYRLRKKMNLEHDAKLTEYLEEISNQAVEQNQAEEG